MKVSFLFLGCLFFYEAYATTRTVSNVPSTLAQFNTIQAAINASTNGDTVLVHASIVAYSGFTISNKRLTIIGPGFNPDMPISQKATIADAIILTGSGTKKTEVQGLFLSTLSVNSAMDSLYILRNNINRVDILNHANGFVFRNNYFRALITSTPSSVLQNILIENNVFEGNNCIQNFTNGSNSNILFNHNLFYAGDGVSGNGFSGISQALFTNNIFVERQFNSSVTLCTFISNLTFNCSPNDPWLQNSNTDGGGNISNMDPMMADQAAVNDGSATEISNFTISSGPANNSGIDGKDLGLLYDPTGGLNWIHGRNARIPSVVSMSVANPVLAAGGTLNITIEARKNE